MKAGGKMGFGFDSLGKSKDNSFIIILLLILLLCFPKFGCGIFGTQEDTK